MKFYKKKGKSSIFEESKFCSLLLLHKLFGGWALGRGLQQITYIGIKRASFKHKLQASLSLHQIRMLTLNTLLSMNVSQLFLYSSQKNLFENQRINYLDISWWRNLWPDQNCLWLSLNLRGRGSEAIYWSKHWIWNFKGVRGNKLRGKIDIGFKIETPNRHAVILLRFEMERCHRQCNGGKS